MKKFAFLALCLPLLSAPVMAAEEEEAAEITANLDYIYQMHDDGYIMCPTQTAIGLIATNDRASEIYLFKDGKMTTLFSGPDCGRYTTLNADRTKMGIKLIDNSGYQAPAILDLTTGNVEQLEPYSEQCGMVSFAADGTYAYPNIHELVVVRNGEKQVYDLGHYVNIANLSQDGKRIAYASYEGYPIIMDLTTGKEKYLSDEDDMFINLWSPNCDKVMFQKTDGTTYIFDLRNNKRHSLGKIFGVQWLDNNTLLYSQAEYENDDYFYFNGISVRTTSFDGMRGQIIIPASLECPQEATLMADGRLAVSYSYGNRRLVAVDMNNYKKEELLYSVPAGHFGKVINLAEFEFVERPDARKLPASTSSTNNAKVEAYDIPYIQQSWDVPTAYSGCYNYGGSACAPCTSCMLLAYYGLIDNGYNTKFATNSYWSNPACSLSRAGGSCSWGSSNRGVFNPDYKRTGAQYHDPSNTELSSTNGWGRYNPYAAYVGLEYTNKQGYTFKLVATKNGCNCKGACGWQWNGGSPASKMGAFYKNSGISNAGYYSAGGTLSNIRNDCDAGYPLPWCITSGRTNGHLILPFRADLKCDKGSETSGNGQVCTFSAKNGCVIVNDPAGNANNATWRSDGRHATYQVSGYSNGYYTMINAWACYAHYTKTSTNVPVTGVSVSPKTLSLKTLRSATLTATVAPANATNTTITWSSNNTGVATVDDYGKVTAVAPGTATITVTTKDGGKTATCAVTVTAPVAGDCNAYEWENKGDMCYAFMQDLNALGKKQVSFCKKEDDGNVYYYINGNWELWSAAESKGYITDKEDFIQYTTFMLEGDEGVEYDPDWVMNFLNTSSKWAWLKTYIKQVMPESSFGYDQAVWRAAVSGFFLCSPANTQYPKTCDFRQNGKYANFGATWDETFCGSSDPKPTDTTYTVTLAASPAGAASLLSGAGTYKKGATVTISAASNSTYTFTKWSDGNTNASRSITVTANATYTAEFSQSSTPDPQGDCNPYNWKNADDMYQALAADVIAAKAAGLGFAFSEDFEAAKQFGPATVTHDVSGPSMDIQTFDEAFFSTEPYKTKWAWLLNYMEARCVADVKDGPISAGDSHSALIRYNLSAFFANGVGLDWPQTANYTNYGAASTQYLSTWGYKFCNSTTDMDEVMNVQPEIRKVMLNGRLYIMVGEKMFDAMGAQIR